MASYDSRGRGSSQLSPDLFLVIVADTVGYVVEFGAERAPSFTGAVVRRPRELNALSELQ